MWVQMGLKILNFWYEYAFTTETHDKNPFHQIIIFSSCVWILFSMQIKYENMMKQKKLKKMNGYDIWSHNIDENLLEIVIIWRGKNEKFTAERDWAFVLMASTFLWSHFDVDVKATPFQLLDSQPSNFIRKLHIKKELK